MQRYIEVDSETGRIIGSATGAVPQQTVEGRAFVDITSRADALTSGAYRADTDTFEPDVVATATRTLSRFEFMSLLTAQERIKLRQRGSTDPIMADALDMLDLAGHVDAVPLHPMIAQMLGYVQQLGIMSAERREEFIAALTAAAK